MLSASELAGSIARGTITARGAVDAYIARVEQVNGALNAVVVKRYDEARSEADAIDRRRAAGETLPPLAGVPITVKECFYLKGTATTFGLPGRAATRRCRRSLCRTLTDRRRDRRRQDECRAAFALYRKRQPGLRAHQQSLEPGAVVRRQQRRRRRDPRRWRFGARTWHRDRRQRADSGGVLLDLVVASDRRPLSRCRTRQHPRRSTDCGQSGRTDGTHGRGPSRLRLR